MLALHFLNKSAEKQIKKLIQKTKKTDCLEINVFSTSRTCCFRVGRMLAKIQQVISQGTTSATL